MRDEKERRELLELELIGIHTRLAVLRDEWFEVTGLPLDNPRRVGFIQRNLDDVKKSKVRGFDIYLQLEKIRRGEKWIVSNSEFTQKVLTFLKKSRKH